MSKRILFPLVLFVFSIFFISGCDSSALNSGNTNPADLLGEWQLFKQTGALQDVCSGEVLKLLNDGVAKLQCPNQNEITRNYTASNGVLIYTQTGVSFNYNVVSGSGQTTLELYGRNVSRNLFYSKITTAPDILKGEPSENKINSSEN
jgi:hypothetical protein